MKAFWPQHTHTHTPQGCWIKSCNLLSTPAASENSRAVRWAGDERCDGELWSREKGPPATSAHPFLTLGQAFFLSEEKKLPCWANTSAFLKWIVPKLYILKQKFKTCVFMWVLQFQDVLKTTIGWKSTTLNCNCSSIQLKEEKKWE